MTRCEKCVPEMNAVCVGIYGSDGCPPCGHEAIDSAILREIAALKAEVASLRRAQLRQPAICAQPAMPKLPGFDMENIRCLESFIAHRASTGAPAWSAWSRVKEFIVAVRQLQQ
jgi:hypothetical protein